MLPVTPAPHPLNLTTCEQEPIRIPGSIQPHGFLLALPQEGARTILQASANLAQMTDVSAAQALGRDWDAILGAPAAAQLEAALAAEGVTGRPAETSLEDVFIRLMELSEDNMR